MVDQAYAAGQIWRPVEHPSLSHVVTHFCDRTRPATRIPKWLPSEIVGMTAQQRFESILWSGELRTHSTFSGGLPAVCFAEATPLDAAFLITRRAYHPWALLFDAASVYEAKGGPVWYARPEEYEALGALGDGSLRTWAVRYDPGSDWREEREWRIPRADGRPVHLSELRLAGLIVGDRNWDGRRYLAMPPGTPDGYYLPRWLPSGVLRYWWDPAAQRLEQLDPVW